MFEVKKATTSKVVLKGLVSAEGVIVDEDGVIRDLNKIVSRAFAEGEYFDFSVTSKSDDTEEIEESEEE